MVTKANETTANVPHRLALWLASSIMGLHEDAKEALIFALMIGHQRMGAALDKCLSKLEGDSPRSPSVLRGQLRVIANALRLKDDFEACVLRLADLYEVATVFPSGNAVDNIYDWFAFVTYGDLLDADKLLTILGYFEQCLTERFMPTYLDPGGSLDRLAFLITKSLDDGDLPELMDLEPRPLAVELRERGIPLFSSVESPIKIISKLLLNYLKMTIKFPHGDL